MSPAIKSHLAKIRSTSPVLYRDFYYRQVLTNPEWFRGIAVDLHLNEESELMLALNYVEAVLEIGVDELMSGRTLGGFWRYEQLVEIAKSTTHKSKKKYFGQKGSRTPIQFLNSILKRFGYCIKVVGKCAKGEIAKNYVVKDAYILSNELASSLSIGIKTGVFIGWTRLRKKIDDSIGDDVEAIELISPPSSTLLKQPRISIKDFLTEMDNWSKLSHDESVAKSL